jgi:hypothetical protein
MSPTQETVPPQPEIEPTSTAATETEASDSPGLLASLACTVSCPTGAFSTIYGHLGKTISELEKHAFALKEDNFDSRLAKLAGPLIARSILEMTCTALIGRFDPFRILMVRETQIQEDYVFTERNPIALNWQSDFHPEQAKGTGSIDLKAKIESMPRSLFGKYFERVLWLEAVERFIDLTPKEIRSDWIVELNRVEPAAFIPAMRTSVQQLYSSCSKGIHQEFVVSKSAYSEAINLKIQIGQALELMAKLSLVFNFSPHVLNSLSIEEAVESFRRLNERWES